MEDTICAISTALGVGAISIIRVSGKDAIKIVSKIFKGSNLKLKESHTITYGFIYDKDEKIDEVLVSVFKAPKTYTKEDIVEINSHGGINTTNKILELLLENGCRLSEPGEFTKRAFLNGRIDLTEAESVNDLINATSSKAREMALNNLGGMLTKKIKDIMEYLIKAMANIEVNIDYPEYDDIEVITNEKLLPQLLVAQDKIEDILKSAKNSRVIKEGINIAIVGKPNVGKSSILNYLLDEEKAIVTDIPGTTRDIVEGSITLNGFLINFIDTAGIRDAKDKVEQIGIDKSKKALSSADLVIIVLNSNEKIEHQELDLINIIPESKRIIFLNKSDLKRNMNISYNYIIGNTKDTNGLNDLKEEIINKLKLNDISKDMTYLSNARQLDLLKKSLNSLNNAIKTLKNNTPLDLVLIDIKDSWNSLAEIVGEVYEDKLLDTLFSNFCLGK